ncbi:hypothetical protein [Actinoplanes sp. NPDC026619]|uniref:hypothetical protein n=1 Tax=Actinoplanes sp. NPDC026619 TaxID=3155798 RepID=UPI0033C7704E
MVLTCAVRKSDTGHTRRRVLGAGLSLTVLGGCGLLDHYDDGPPPAPDPLQPLADEALALAAAYDRAAVSLPALAARITPLAEDHRAHAAELARVIGRTPVASASAAAAPSAPATDPAAALAGLRAAEQTAMKSAVTACATTTELRAGLVGSIAACRATHVEALR